MIHREVLKYLHCQLKVYGSCGIQNTQFIWHLTPLSLISENAFRWTHWGPDVIQMLRFLCVNTLRPRQNRRHFADDTFNRIFVNENVRISNKFSLKFVPKRPINNIQALVQIMAWCRPGDKPLSEPMMVCLLTHIGVTRPQWVNWSFSEPRWHQTWRRHLQQYFKDKTSDMSLSYIISSPTIYASLNWVINCLGNNLPPVWRQTVS